MGITSETMKIHPIQLAIHQVDGVPLVSIMHTDVYRMRDVNAPETVSVHCFIEFRVIEWFLKRV
jgi:tRNA A37 threonylcarbamoyladenosine biosynthesis protein TsaE